MSHSKWLYPFLILGLCPLGASAEPQRALFSHENNFPRWEQFEAGVEFNMAELEASVGMVDVWDATPYIRYGLLDNLAARVDVPYRNVDPDFGDSESGLGDVEVELQLLAYEDIFGYPYYIPYVNVSLPTGDEDKGLGEDDVVVTPGMAYGGRIRDWIGWVIDVGYRINPDRDNQFLVSHSYLWDISEDFTLLTEVRYEEESEGDEDSKFLLTGGFSYNWSRKLQMAVHAGSGISGETDVLGQVRFTYSF